MVQQEHAGRQREPPHRQDGEPLWAAPYLPWPADVLHADAKLLAARRLAAEVRDGEVVGIGSGSSAYLALRAIAERCSDERLSVKVVPTSQETEVAASHLGLGLARLGDVAMAWMVDGADEVDPDGRFLKGRGGALFKEKLLWASCDRRYVVLDASKRVTTLGQRYPVPVEVHPNAAQRVAAYLEEAGATHVGLRTGTGKDGPVITENGFLILEARFRPVPVGLHDDIKRVPGVLETGIFEGYPAQLVEVDPPSGS
jgi:ribose 5-phosphate isomerase A